MASRTVEPGGTLTSLTSSTPGAQYATVIFSKGGNRLDSISARCGEI